MTQKTREDTGKFRSKFNREPKAANFQQSQYFTKQLIKKEMSVAQFNFGTVNPVTSGRYSRQRSAPKMMGAPLTIKYSAKT